MGRLENIWQRAATIAIALFLVVATTSQFTLHLCGGIKPVSHCGCPEGEDRGGERHAAFVDASCCSAELVVVEHSVGEPVRKDTCPTGQVALAAPFFVAEPAALDVHVPAPVRDDPGRGPPVPLLLQKRVLLI
ncbi:hypothetical protein L6R52_43555 [Myxococcota bacterium]|nr:hypothetical protein [Myxococcota bacterium]